MSTLNRLDKRAREEPCIRGEEPDIENFHELTCHVSSKGSSKPKPVVIIRRLGLGLGVAHLPEHSAVQSFLHYGHWLSYSEILYLQHAGDVVTFYLQMGHLNKEIYSLVGLGHKTHKALSAGRILQIFLASQKLVDALAMVFITFYCSFQTRRICCCCCCCVCPPSMCCEMLNENTSVLSSCSKQ